MKKKAIIQNFQKMKTHSSVTFVSESTRDNNELLGMNELPDKSDDILFTFENGKLFRLQCEQIKLTYET